MAICSHFSLAGEGNDKIVKNSNPSQKRTGRFWTKKRWRAETHRTEWCAAARKYRRKRCGGSGTQISMPGTCEGPRWLGKDSKRRLKRWSEGACGRA